MLPICYDTPWIQCSSLSPQRLMLKNQFYKFGANRDSNQRILHEKRDRCLCAVLPPLVPLSCILKNLSDKFGEGRGFEPEAAE